MKLNRNTIINFLIICIPLCPYKLLSIGDKDVSLIYLGFGAIIFVCLATPKGLSKSIRKNWIVLLIILYLIINCIILNNKNWGSIIQIMVLWIIMLISYRVVTKKEFNKTIEVFNKLMNIMAIYGIYQFVGRIFGLPFSDLWIDGFMVGGYNWYDWIKIGSLQVARSNGIFIEPSMFSQFLAINILLLFFSDSFSHDKKNRWMIINGIALLLSFSGTGIVLLIIGYLVLMISKTGIKTVMKYIRKHILLVVLFVVTIAIVFISPIGTYLVSRLLEFDPTNTRSVSGYIRFVGQFNIAAEVLKSNPVIGIGIGNVQGFINVYRFSGGANAFASFACSMIVARYLAELGVIGLILLIAFYKGLIKRNRFIDQNYKVLLVCALIMIPLSDTGISVYYWTLLFIINMDFKDNERRGAIIDG